MKFEKETIRILEKALTELEDGFSHLPDPKVKYDYEKIEEVILKAAEKMKNNFPYFHPFYAGQMLKPPHPAAQAAYMLSLFINPNNHALDGGKATSEMEKEAVSEIANLFGWKTFLGHLTGGGTMANLEALWISNQINSGKKIVASEQAHYTHKRIAKVLGINFESVDCDNEAKINFDSLKKILNEGETGTVVVTIGTTAFGSVDPLKEILDLKEKYNFRIHADAAYGGYFILANNLDNKTRETFDLLKEVDSIVIDPHKHGLQPYGCGCVIFKDPEVGKFYKHDSPYTYFTSEELHLGEISLECSRPGASAAALWTTQKLLPLKPKGIFSDSLSKCREACLKLYEKINSDKRFKVVIKPELDIIVWAPNKKSAGEISRLSEEIFSAAEKENLYLAKIKLSSSFLKKIWKEVNFDQENVTCFRSCLMKPEHTNWIDEIWNILNKIMQ